MAANRKRSSSATKLTAALGALASVGSTRPKATSSPNQQDSKYLMAPESINSTSLDGIHKRALSAASSANSSQTNLTLNAEGRSAIRASPNSGDVITINFANQGSMSDPEVDISADSRRRSETNTALHNTSNLCEAIKRSIRAIGTCNLQETLTAFFHVGTSPAMDAQSDVQEIARTILGRDLYENRRNAETSSMNTPYGQHKVWLTTGRAKRDPGATDGNDAYTYFIILIFFAGFAVCICACENESESSDREPPATPNDRACHQATVVPTGMPEPSMHRPPPAGSENATTESQTHLRTRLMGFVAANFGPIKAAAEESASRAGDRKASSSALLAQHASRMRDFFRRVSEDDRRPRAEDWELQDLEFQGEAEEEGERGDRTAHARPRVSQDTEDGRSQSPTGSLISEQPSSQ